MTKRTALLASLALGAVTLLLSATDHYRVLDLPHGLLVAARWFATAAFGIYAYKHKKFTAWIFFAMFLGTLIGVDYGFFGIPEGAVKNLYLIPKIFIRLIKAIIGPLIFATLVVGIAGNDDLKQVGRMGWKSITYFTAGTIVALSLGLVSGNLFRPGDGMEAPADTNLGELSEPKTWQEAVLHSFPENIAKSIAEGEILQLVIFSVLFGIGLAMVKGPMKQVMLRALNSLTEVMFKFTHVVMYLAPFAAGAALAYAIAGSGIEVLGNLGKLVLGLYLALLGYVLLVLLPVALIIRLPLRNFLKAVSEPASLAFATASSESALPKALEMMERVGVPRKIVAFVLPTGYSFNLDGSALYLSLATIFVAQAAGVDLPLSQQLNILLILLLTSKGVAGVARASFVILASTVSSQGLPEWPLALILGIDVIMDMGRTTVNLVGNCLATAVIARWEGEYNDAVGHNPDWDNPLPVEAYSSNGTPKAVEAAKQEA